MDWPRPLLRSPEAVSNSVLSLTGVSEAVASSLRPSSRSMLRTRERLRAVLEKEQKTGIGDEI
jgi:hypothetical protein